MDVWRVYKYSEKKEEKKKKEEEKHPVGGDVILTAQFTDHSKLRFLWNSGGIPGVFFKRIINVRLVNVSTSLIKKRNLT